jgi:hypothetical protein
MRSDLAYQAMLKVDNRFLLCRMISLSTKKFHDPRSRVQDTICNVIERIANTEITAHQYPLVREPEASESANPHSRAFSVSPSG